jgi:hypothetical protein
MFFATLILVSVDGEHDRLQERVDLGHGNKSAEMGDMTRLRLEQEEQVAIFLRLIVVWEYSFLHLGSIF